jgi:O-antigen ligase
LTLIPVIWFATLAHAGHDLWALVVIGLASTLLVVLTLGRAARRAQAIKLPLLPSFLLLLIALYLSSIHSYNVEATWIEFWGWVFSILLFYVFMNHVDTLEKRDQFFKRAGLILIPLAGICIAEALFYRVWNVHGTLINSTVLAGFALCWPLFYTTQARPQRTDLYCGGASLLILVLSLQRTAIGLVFIGFAWIYLRSKSSQAVRTSNRRLFFAILTIGLLAVIYLRHYQAVMGATPWTSYLSLNRWHYWKSALAMWRQSPWTGNGLGSYETVYPYFRKEGVENTRFAHSFPLQWLAETGLIGVFALIGLLGSAIRLYTSLDSPTDSKRPIFELTLLLILLYGAFTISLNYWINKCLLLLFLGAILVGRPMRTLMISRLWAICLGVCLLLMIPFWLNLWVASRLYVAGLVASDSEGNLPKAMHLHRQAISLESFHADSYAQLARLFAEQYKRTHDPADLSKAQSYLQSAYRYKKDVRYLSKSS